MYRVLISEYTTSGGSYESVDGTVECIGEGYNARDAHQTALNSDTRYHISWYEKFHEGLWYNCDHNGVLGSLADPQEVPFSEDTVEDMTDSPENYGLSKDEYGEYIIPKSSGAEAGRKAGESPKVTHWIAAIETTATTWVKVVTDGERPTDEDVMDAAAYVDNHLDSVVDGDHIVDIQPDIED